MILFQEAHMENRMHLPPRRGIDFVSYLANSLEDCHRANILFKQPGVPVPSLDNIMRVLQGVKLLTHY